MRGATPPQKSPSGPGFPMPPALVEQLAEGLAMLLIEEWKTKHSQQVSAHTVKSPQGLNGRGAEGKHDG